MLFSLAATSLVLIVGYVTAEPTAPNGPQAIPVVASPTSAPEDGFSSASLSESGACYIVRGFGLPVVESDGPMVDVATCSDMIGSDRGDQRRHRP